MSKLSRGQALEDISNWSSQDVLSLLRKHNLEECCLTIEKRQINGDALLHLTEGKLALWKNDLSRPLKWQLWSFVEELKKNPEQFVEQKNKVIQSDDDTNEGTSWDSDFGDDEDENDFAVSEVQTTAVVISKPVDLATKKLALRENLNVSSNGIGVKVRTSAEILEENMYANCDHVEENEYANLNAKACDEKKLKALSIQNKQEKSLAEQLKEQLALLKNTTKRQDIRVEETRNSGDNEEGVQKLHKPRTSFLHAKTSEDTNVIKRMTVAPPPEPKKCEKVEENLSRGIIRNFDLVANLPTKTEESEDEYESFDHSSTTVSNAESKLSVNSSITHNSTDNIYHPNSIASYDDEPIDEIYESINEPPDVMYHRPEDENENGSNVIPPPLPPKPSSCSSLQSLNSNSSKTESERSPDKKNGLPHSSSTVSLSIDRASRPLPTPPDRLSYTEKPWFHNVTREQATIIIKEQSTYGNTNRDGYFLMRPSSTNPNNPLALVLWYNDRVYNVPVRKRPDNRFALGSAKPNEQSFSNVEEIVTFYKREELILYTGGIQMGSTKLTDTPSK